MVRKGNTSQDKVDPETHPKLLLGSGNFRELFLVLLNLRFVPLEVTDDEPLFTRLGGEFVQNTAEHGDGVKAEFVVLGKESVC